MCNVLDVSRSGYYIWLEGNKSRRVMENEAILKEIKRVRLSRRKTAYGAPRMHRELVSNGFKCGKNRVARIMSRNGIKSTIRRKWKARGKPRDNQPITNDLVRRDFSASRANELWTADITYVWTEEGWLYLAIVLDVFSRKIVGWSMNKYMDKRIVLNALKSASLNRHVIGKAIFHSDRGSQFTCIAVQEALCSLGLKQSMSGRGNCYDNAITESFFHTLKVELVYQERFKTRKEASLALFEYIEGFYNRERRHSSLGYLSPEEFEKQALPVV
jgi:transposase InsO family protein